jgi:hypothetical protein
MKTIINSIIIIASLVLLNSCKDGIFEMTRNAQLKHKWDLIEYKFRDTIKTAEFDTLYKDYSIEFTEEYFADSTYDVFYERWTYQNKYFENKGNYEYKVTDHIYLYDDGSLLPTREFAIKSLKTKTDKLVITVVNNYGPDYIQMTFDKVR